ncbi:hypothetical protein NVR49_21140 [Enterobacter roggenkampii]|uniref:hypothetical protein n=1 Tax=Enterobacter roggenkampii TaxID=1812935 RepID=UPI00254D93D9|nr:hypothetical protein [Enterobacter roggenkampii]MDL0009092.1 hypothetical protein [Enterobacter roggenkampii]
MKEQLANMTIIELVRTAHSYATSIQQVETYSAIVTELAARLEALNLAHIGGMNSLRSAISERDQLATENAALTKFIDDDCWVIDPDRDSYIDAAQCVPETPATDAFLREQMAKGVEMLATLAGNEYQRHKSVNDRPGMRKWKSIVILCTDFAAQLRAGEVV